MEDIKWDFIIEDINLKKCILFLGPEINIPEGENKPLYLLIEDYLRKYENNGIIEFPDNDNFYRFSDNIEKQSKYRTIKRFCEQFSPSDILKKITEIPFHLIISLNPDYLLNKTTNNNSINEINSWYAYSKPQSPISLPQNNNRLIYKLFGSFDDMNSLVLTHDDQYEFIESILGDFKIPTIIQNELINAFQIIFLGFQYDKWYIQLLMRIIGLHRNDKITAIRNASNNAYDKDIKELCFKHFSINLKEISINDFINTLYNRFKELKIETNNPILQMESKNKEIFISYAWGDDTKEGIERDEIVNKICVAFSKKGYIISRDKDVLSYKSNIDDFMKKIGAGKYVITIVSNKYLKSKYCMYEAKEMIKYSDFEKKIFPVVLKDADIFSTDGQFEFALYWKENLDKLSKQLDVLGRGSENMEFLQNERDFKEIREIIAKFMTTIARWNVLTPKMLEQNDFEDLIVAIERKISEDEK